MHESLNLLYGITIERLATNAFKDSDFSFRPAHTFRRKLASHLEPLVSLLEGDILRLADVAVLNGSAADYFAYLAFFHDMLPGSTRGEGSLRGDESLADQFRGLLLREMDKRHIREADLARACGCSLQNIAQIFNGRTGLRFDTAEKLCRSIGLRIVISLKEEPPTDPKHE